MMKGIQAFRPAFAEEAKAKPPCPAPTGQIPSNGEICPEP